ncbi:MAG TPA: sodium:proton antiporter [Bryobacteraceae bacterium]|nr:sodium:proton antiporter [Bryobacteraceae bacterium]
MSLSFGTGILLLLLVAAVVAILAARLRLPYSVGLVAAGMALAVFPMAPRITLTRELIFDALLPPLLFEAAFHLRWKELRRELPVVLTLASAGVVLSGAVTAAGMHYVGHWEWSAAVVFGALIAATDPVSVIAAFREAKVHGRLRLLIESESLLNDGTAAVAFGVAVIWARGGGVTAAGIGGALLLTAGGGIACGLAIGALALFLMGRTEDHVTELTFTTLAAYGSFLLADQLNVSGVFATIAAGLLLGNCGAMGRLSDRGREAVEAFWEYAAFVANSLVFLLIGMHEPAQRLSAFWLPALVAVVFVAAGRLVAVYPLCAIFMRSERRVTKAHQDALFWGGLRGALALALALGLPKDMPSRTEIVEVSFAVVAFSVFAQGLTIPPLLRAIGEIPRQQGRPPG